MVLYIPFSVHGTLDNNSTVFVIIVEHMHVNLQVLKLKEMWAYYNNVMQHLTHDENVMFSIVNTRFIILLLTALSVFKPLKLFSSQFVLIIQKSVI